MKNYIPKSDLPDHARRAIGGRTQAHVSQMIYAPQSRISEALNGKSDLNAFRLILRMYEEETGQEAGPAEFETYYRFPDAVVEWLDELEAAHTPAPLEPGEGLPSV